jgi:hypothetical protein
MECYVLVYCRDHLPNVYIYPGKAYSLACKASTILGQPLHLLSTVYPKRAFVSIGASALQ